MMKPAIRVISGLTLVMVLGCGRSVRIEDVLENPAAYEGKTLVTESVRIHVSAEAAKVIKMMDIVLDGKGAFGTMMPTATTIDATSKDGRRFSLIVDLRRKGLATKVAACSTGEEETVVIHYATKTSEWIDERGDLVLTDIRAGKCEQENTPDYSGSVRKMRRLPEYE